MFEQKSKSAKISEADSGMSGFSQSTPESFGLSNSEALSALGFSDTVQKKEMPGSVTEKMSQAFGTDFSNVSVYESPLIAQAGARAVASGTSIGFAPGQFNPQTQEGQSLLGHELSHVVQQSTGKVPSSPGKGISLVDDSSFESKADVDGMKAARGEKVST